MDKKPKKNPGESVRQKLKNLSIKRKRPFDEILSYYAIERFLYRLSISKHNKKFFLKGGLLLKVWDSLDHRATIDIDLLAKTSNNKENLHQIISDIASIQFEEDSISYITDKLILRDTQAGGVYAGVNIRFLAKLANSKIPMSIDVGFNDIIIPGPEKIHYPTLLEMPEPKIFGYPAETVIAEKLESIVKLSIINTRMKDFYDIWTIFRTHKIDESSLKDNIVKVFNNRKTVIKFPLAFTPEFYESATTKLQWKNFLDLMGKKDLSLKDVIIQISEDLKIYFD